MKWGALDIGSNSVRCLAVERKGNELLYLASGAWITRLTEGLSLKEVQIRREALLRTCHAVISAVSLLDEQEIPQARRFLFATESLRSASNAEEVQSELERAAKLSLEILDGQKEARLSFLGATVGLSESDIVFDLGGGSLELCDGVRSLSVPIGAVRMATNFGEDADAIRSHALGCLKDLPFCPSSPIGVGGTSSSVAMMLKGVALEAYHPAKVHGHEVTSLDLETLLQKLRTLSIEKRAEQFPGLDPKRADIIVAGIAVLQAVLEALGVDRYRHSECDLLWGILIEKMRDVEEGPVKRILW